MSNSIQGLRKALFEQLRTLQNCSSDEIDTETKRSIHMVQLADTIIDTARVENEFLSLGNTELGTGFIKNSESETNIPALEEEPEELFKEDEEQY